MISKVLINSGNINSKVLITDKKVKYIEEPEQLQWNELKNEEATTTSTTTNIKINNITSQIDKNEDNIKQINR